jgi:phosphate:Na+ symporter
MNLGDALMYFLAGLALFLLGITMLSDSLKAVAGNRLKSIIEKSTNTPLKSVLVGILLTISIQSSSGATVLTIGLLRAGLMTFPQSVGIIMGANIGTTVTAFIIGLPIAKYGPIFLAVGVFMQFMKRKKIRYIGGAIIGIGMLFYGLQTMETGLRPLANTKFAETMFQTFGQNWFLGTLFGTFFTSIVQSSSASIGVLQKLYAINATGVQSIQLIGAIPILLGANIGTTITAMIASWGGNKDSKRAALIHVIFNVFSAIVFLSLLKPYGAFITWIEARFLTPYSMLTIAFAHAVQNLVTTIVLFFFIRQMVNLVMKIVKDDKKTILIDEMFDETLIAESPVLALEFVKKAILQMGGIVRNYFYLTKDYSFKENSKLIDQGLELEALIDTYDEKLHDYLIKIARYGLDMDNSRKLSRDLDTIKDFERIGDHLQNIMEFFEERYMESQFLNEEAVSDLDELYTVLETMLNDTLKSFEHNNIELARRVLVNEDRVDELEEIFRYRYIEQLKEGQVTFVIAANYADILSNLERIGDHLVNIAESVIEPMHVPQSIIVGKTKSNKSNT